MERIYLSSKHFTVEVGEEANDWSEVSLCVDRLIIIKIQV